MVRGGHVASKMHDVRYWLARAEDAQRHAQEMTHPPAKREMLLIAESAWPSMPKTGRPAR